MRRSIGSWRPQTMIAKRALFEQLARLGVVNPMDPMQRYQLATVMGAAEMMPGFKEDMDLTARRIDQLSQGVEVPPPAPWENHPLAVSLISRFMKTEKFEMLPPPIKQRIQMYASLHFQFIQMAAQMQAGGQRGQITPAGGPEGPGNKGVGKGGLGGAGENPEKAMSQRDAQAQSHPQMAGLEPGR